jgi:hypothetical protein
MNSTEVGVHIGRTQTLAIQSVVFLTIRFYSYKFEIFDSVAGMHGAFISDTARLL